MPGLVRQMADLHPSLWNLAYLGTHFQWVPQPSSEGWQKPSEINPSTDQVFQNSLGGLTMLALWVSLSAMWMPLTPKSLIRMPHSFLVWGSSLMVQSMSLARFMRACLTNQLTMPGLAPQQEMAVVFLPFFRTSLSMASRRPQLLLFSRSISSFSQQPSHSSLTVSIQKTPQSWQYWMMSEDEVPTERLTQKPTFPTKILSRIDLKFSLVSPILMNSTFSLTWGSSTGSGSMMVILSNLKCFLISGRVPLPIDPCPTTQMSLMCPQTCCCSIGNLIHYKELPKLSVFPLQSLRIPPRPQTNLLCICHSLRKRSFLTNMRLQLRQRGLVFFPVQISTPEKIRSKERIRMAKPIWQLCQQILAPHLSSNQRPHFQNVGLKIIL